LPLLLSSDQKAHSAAGTASSAFGKTTALSLVVRPVMWSAWKWLKTIWLTRSGSIPAASMLCSSSPEVAESCPPPVPVSKAITCFPVSRKVTVKGLSSRAVGSSASTSACSTASGGWFATMPVRAGLARGETPSNTVVTVKPPTLKR
jgi:hypothetical protein